MMKRPKAEPLGSKRLKLSHLLLGVAVLYLLFISLKVPRFLEIASMLNWDDSYVGMDGTTSTSSVEEPDLNKPLFSSVYKDAFHSRLEDNDNQNAPLMPQKNAESQAIKPLQHRYGRITGEIMRRRNRKSELSTVEIMADEAWTLGLKAWEEVGNFTEKENMESSIVEGKSESCPSSVSIRGEELDRGDRLMFLPCGLAAGSSITVIGIPQYAHKEYIPQLARLRTADATVLVSQFMVELQGLKSVDGEDPPKILHLNPRLRGDWSKRAVIEHNTCYRMQWGTAQRCDGLQSKNDEDMLGKCLLWFLLTVFYFKRLLRMRLHEVM